MIELVVAGAAGRMGGRIITLARQSADLAVVGALERPGHPALGRDAGEVAGASRLGVPVTADPAAVLIRDRVLVEFTAPEATLEHLRVAAAQGTRAVVGTTGLGPALEAELRGLAARTAILYSPNMSVGVNVAFQVLALMARALGDEYDVEITEIHHRMKKDAPSGTAAKMAEVIAAALGRDLGAVGVYGRHGMVGERGSKEIGVHALRGGDVVGEHTVVFVTHGERLELTHRAHTRDNFVQGALRAVRFVATARPGLYSMADALGLERP
jgi:4-hydroxy-tetrahydrodipicolinate reductase